MHSQVLFRGLVALAAMVVAPAGSAVEPPAVELFARKLPFFDLKLSPDGSKVAAQVQASRSGAIVVLSVPELKQIGGLRLDGEQQFVAYSWASDSQLVGELGRREGPLAPVDSSGELVAFNADGSNLRYLLGQDGSEGKIGSRLGARNRKRAFNTVIDPLVDDPDRVVIASWEFNVGEDAKAVVSRLNLKTSRLEELAVAPAAGTARFLLDRQGRPRFVTVGIDAFAVRTWQRGPDQQTWQPLQADGELASARPVALAEDGKSVFLDSREFGPRSCLVRQQLETGERVKLACHPQADVDHLIRAFASGGEPIAAVFEAGKPETQLLDTGHPDIDVLRLLQEAFPGKQVEIASTTRDGSRLLVRTHDDRTLGDYYLFNARTKAADFLVAEGDWLDPEWMGERRPIAVKARDGSTVHGYLTVPPGSDGKKLPLVVHPHGGPFDTRDHWGFDPDPQLLATRGYAVLQVNFRGSDGYGFDFERQGRRAWGTTMIDDITDATRWLVDQGYADPARVCIFGASYGGYAAMMSAVREPDRYRCVIAEAGVYDLKLWKSDVDFIETDRGKRYFETGVAASDEEMLAQSPLSQIDRLKAPVLIIHGEDDRRAPLTQARALRKALDARKHPYEWLVKADERHGFFKDENVLARDRAVLEFLARHIGSAR